MATAEENGRLTVAEREVAHFQRRRGPKFVTDNAGPVVGAFNPRNGGRGVGLDGTITVNFDEDVFPNKVPALARVQIVALGTGHASGADVVVVDVGLGSSRVTFQGATLAIGFPAEVRQSTFYSLVLPARAVQDIHLNNFSGLEKGEYRFSTGYAADLPPDPGDNTILVVMLLGVALLLLCAAVAGLRIWQSRRKTRLEKTVQELSLRKNSRFYRSWRLFNSKGFDMDMTARSVTSDRPAWAADTPVEKVKYGLLTSFVFNINDPPSPWETTADPSQVAWAERPSAERRRQQQAARQQFEAPHQQELARLRWLQEASAAPPQAWGEASPAERRREQLARQQLEMSQYANVPGQVLDPA